MRYTEAEYLELERASSEKHAFVNGDILAMAGGSLAHSLVGGRLVALLDRALVVRPCRVHNSERRVKVEATGMYVYPDATVVCGSHEVSPSDRTSLTNPTVVFEVLSHGTEADDRGWKFQHYKRIPGLLAYVIVDPRDRHVEVATPLDDGRWAIAEIRGAGSIVAIDAIGVSLELDSLFEGLDELPPEE